MNFQAFGLAILSEPDSTSTQVGRDSLTGRNPSHQRALQRKLKNLFLVSYFIFTPTIRNMTDQNW